VVRTAPKRPKMGMEMGLANTIPAGGHNSSSPNWASSNPYLYLSQGISAAQVPNTNPEPAKLRPVARTELYCLKFARLSMVLRPTAGIC